MAAGRRCAGLRVAAALVLGATATAAVACQAPAEPRSLAQRLAEAPLAFIGVVRSVSDSEVVFTVEHRFSTAPAPVGSLERRAAPALRESAGEIAVLRRPASTCVIEFVPGERWLYAGGTTGDGSVALGPAAARRPDAIGLLRRNDDRALALPRQWQRCTEDAQCIPIRSGCVETAVAVAHVDAARNRLARRDAAAPSASCPTSRSRVATGQALCVANRCGGWSLGFVGR